MDGIVISIVAAILMLVYWPRGVVENPIDQMDVIVPNPHLNPEMLHDEHAFMKIANELGFH